MKETKRNHFGKLMYYCRKNYSFDCRAEDRFIRCPHDKMCRKLHKKLMKHDPYKTEAHGFEVEIAKKK